VIGQEGKLTYVSNYEQAGRRYPIPAAESCLALTAEYDVLLRSMGGGLEGVLMDRYVCTVIGKSVRLSA
jgi:hypothetical protein